MEGILMNDSSGLTLVVEKDPKRIIAGRYVVDSIHTRVMFNVVHFGISNYWGEFYGPVGSLDIDPTAPDRTALSVSVLCGQVKTNSQVLDAELRSAEWFDAERFPNITLSGQGLNLRGDNMATFTGDFTLHGVTRPVEFHVEFTGAGTSPFTGQPTIGFEARATISRRAFGVSAKYPIVGDAVNLIVSAAFDFA
jgi:polyisoprenoid-binding protein YceI